MVRYLALVTLARPAGATELTLRDGRPFCQAYACGALLPEAEAFRTSTATTLPVIEALRDGKVYAYLFLSTDLVDIPAYSGKPLVTLIAIDPQGIVLKAVVVHHNEPILLVGLPETVLNDYLAQYIGRSILDRFAIVSGGIQDVSPTGRQALIGRHKPGEPVGIHMITGATVTALVLEETLLTGARQVGHALGLIATDAQRTVTWKADYVPKSWPVLVQEGSIGHLRVDAREMDPEYTGDEPWIDLYFGELTPPVVGVNVLGEAGYNWLQKALKPGEKAIFVVANGISSFKGSGFVRGGIFDRFHLEQGLNSYSFKDLDYENLYGIEAEAAPRFKESGIFFLRDTRFDSTRPWQFVFLTHRLTGETATSKSFQSFSQAYHLPDIYYDVHEPAASKPPSLVERIWQERLIEVAALSFLLAATMGIFFSRRWMTASAKRLEMVHLAVMAASIAVIGLWLKTPPSVTQIFPFVRLFDEGIRFELFLADPLLFVFWLFIVASLILWGRGWFCGWICPYSTLLELLHKLSSYCLPRRMLFEFSQRTHDRLRLARYLILAGLMVMAVLSLEWAERLAEIEPFKTTWILGVFKRDWGLSLYWWLLIAAGVFNFRFFCRYVCPLGAALSLGSALRLIGIRRKEFCQKCTICARGCQSRAIDPQGQINKYECLYCLECESNYGDDQVCPPLVVARRHAEKMADQSEIGLRVLPMALLVGFWMMALSFSTPRFSLASEIVVPGPHTPTLNAALRLAAPGDHLRIQAGVYRERLTITKPLTLSVVTGAENKVMIDGGGKGRVVDIQAPDVTLRGLTLRGSGDDIEQVDACVYIHNDAHRTQLLNNTMTQCLFGVWVNGANDTMIVGNTIRGLSKPMYSDRGNGINLWQVRNTRVERNVISEVRDGIYLSVSTDSRVTGNLLHHLRFGIHYMYNDQNQIIGNVACHNLVGLAMMFSKQLEIRGNLALFNRDHGILFRTIVDSRIWQNRAEGNGKGFFLNDVSFNELTQNNVRGNRIGVHITAGHEGNRVHRNNFVDNAVQVRFSQREPIFWDTPKHGNFWSDYLGWDMNRDGRGDSRYYSARRMDAIVYRYPLVKQLAASPVVQLLQALEARFPVLRPSGVVDRRPFMRPTVRPVPTSTAAPRHDERNELPNADVCVAPVSDPDAS